MPTATMNKQHKLIPLSEVTPETTDSDAKLFDEVQTVEIDEAARKLMQECGAIKISWHWFKTSIKIDNNAKSAMANAANTTNAGFSASKRLMDSKHPTIKEANELRGRVQSYIRGISLPVTKLGDTAAGGKKEGGVFLVRRNDLADFEERMTAFVSQLKTMETKVNAAMGSIKSADMQRLGSLFKEADYPAQVQIRTHYYPVNLEPPAYLEKFAPKMFKEAKQKAEVWWQGVYENAATDFMEEFKAVISSWVEALGPITRIYPPEGHALYYIGGAEVRKKTTHNEDPSVPEGRVVALIRYKNPTDKTETIEKQFDLPDAEYTALKPRESADKPKTFKNSTVENLLDMIGKFRKLGTTLSASAEFNSLVDAVEKEVGKAGVKPSEIGEELRQSKSFRGGMHALMKQAQEKLTSELHTFTRKRRKVDVGLLRGTNEDD